MFYDKNGDAVQNPSGANRWNLKISPLQASNNGDTYTCTVVLNNQESTHSNSVEITVVGKFVCACGESISGFLVMLNKCNKLINKVSKHPLTL